MKNSIYFLISGILFSTILIQGQQFPSNSPREDYENLEFSKNVFVDSNDSQHENQNPNPESPSVSADDSSNDNSSKNNDDKKDKKKPLPDSASVKLSPGFFKYMYFEPLKKETYVTVETSQVVTSKARFEVVDGLVIPKADYEITGEVFRIFNKKYVESCLRQKLEDGTEVMRLPEGMPIQKEKIDGQKVVLAAAVIGLAALAAIFVYKNPSSLLSRGGNKGTGNDGSNQLQIGVDKTFSSEYNTILTELKNLNQNITKLSKLTPNKNDEDEDGGEENKSDEKKN